MSGNRQPHAEHLDAFSILYMDIIISRGSTANAVATSVMMSKIPKKIKLDKCLFQYQGERHGAVMGQRQNGTLDLTKRIKMI